MRKTLDADHERRLIEQALRNADAFRELYRYYLPRVYAYVAYRVGHASEAEDVTANIFLKVIEGLNSFEHRGAGSFAAWVFRIAYSQVGQHYRRQPRGEMLSLDDISDTSAGNTDLAQMMVHKERFRRLRQIIATLSPRRQEIITMKFYGGLNNQEIASVLGLDERTVASHLCRAIEDLQRRYEHEMDTAHELE